MPNAVTGDARRPFGGSRLKRNAAGKARWRLLAGGEAQWFRGYLHGNDLYVLSHIREFVEAAVARVGIAEIKDLNVVDGGDGASFTGTVANFPMAVLAVLEQTGRAVGVDMRALLKAPERQGGRS